MTCLLASIPCICLPGPQPKCTCHACVIAGESETCSLQPIMHLKVPRGLSGVRGEPHRQLPPRVHGQPQGEAAGDQRYERHQVKSASPPLYSGDRAPAQVRGEEASYEPACNHDELSFCQHPVHATGHRSERASSCSGDASVYVPGPPLTILTGACRRHSTVSPLPALLNCKLQALCTEFSAWTKAGSICCAPMAPVKYRTPKAAPRRSASV